MKETKKEIQDRKVFNIPEANMGSFKSKIGRLQKRAVKLGCGEIRYEVLKTYMKPVKKNSDFTIAGEFEEPIMMKYYEIEISGDQPKLAGWLFAARLEHDPQIGTMIRTVPGIHIPPKLYDADLYNCDHCKKRIFRRDTFIIKHEETDEWKQVGRVCLRDFLGHDNPENVAKYCECLFSAAEAAEDSEFFNGGGGRTNYYYELESFLATTAAMIRGYGWTSRTKAKESDFVVATADRVEAYIFGKAKKDYKDVIITEADTEEAKKVIEWATAINVSQNWEDEYKWNIKLIAEAGIVDYWKAGFAASMLVSYRKEIARNEAKKNTKWVGELDQRMEFKNAKCVFVTSFETRYGTSHLYKFIYDERAALAWFASSPQEINQGDTCDITGTVKKHDEYREEKQTIIKRCKIANVKKET